MGFEQNLAIATTEQSEKSPNSQSVLFEGKQPQFIG